MNSLNLEEFESFLKNYHVKDFATSFLSKANTYQYFCEWIDRGDHGNLSYLLDHRAKKRQDIRNYFPEFKSSLSFVFDYGPVGRALGNYLNNHPDYNGLKIASYALAFDGEDYHHVLSRHLKEIAHYLQQKNKGINFKVSLDIHPVLERDLFHKSGLGFIGKNSMLISTAYGSYTLLGSLFLDQLIEFNPRFTPSTPDGNHCGSCIACIEACPTQAIIDGKFQIDAAKCISTFTIETFKDGHAPTGYSKGSNELFGCDICQDVCPWNNKVEEVSKNFIPSPLLQMILDFFLLRPKSELIKELEGLSNRAYKRKFEGTSFERLGKIGMLKNLKAIS